MFEAHGWATARGAGREPARQDPELEAAVAVLASVANIVVRFDSDVNGESVLSLTAFNNHRTQAVFDLFAWIAANRPDSYGLLYVRDDEDGRGFDKSFRVWRIAGGRFKEMDDPFLSPVVPAGGGPIAWGRARIHRIVASVAARDQHFRATLEQTIRSVGSSVAVLVIALSLAGIVGVRLVDRRVTDAVLKGFGVVETAVGVINAGMARIDGLIGTSRMEVRQAAETIIAVGARAEANSIVLNALNERLETSLAPRIAQVQQALAPVRDAVAMIGNAVSLANSLPMLADRAPRLAALDEALNRLEQLSADSTQLRGTLRALAGTPKSQLTAETVAVLSGLTQRIDTKLGEVQAGVQGVQADIAAWQHRLDVRKSRLLFLFNLLALLMTLMLAWILYSQIVVLRHYRRSPDEIGT